MIIYMCDNCGCEVKDEKPDLCPLCRRKRADFSEYEFPDPDSEEIKSQKLYDEALAILDEYTKGLMPESAKDAFEE
jgi:hypothetical protein